MKSFNPDTISTDCISLEAGEFALINNVPFEAISAIDGVVALKQTKNAKREYLKSIQKQLEEERDQERAEIMGDINSAINPLGFSCYEIDAMEPQEEEDLAEVFAYVGDDYDPESLLSAKADLAEKGYWVIFVE